MDFSQARIAPESVIRGLEWLDPTACIVHMGGPRWLVGKIRHSSAAKQQAEAMMDRWTHGIRAGAQLSETAKHKVRFAQLALLGFRPVQQYDLIGAPDQRIVADFGMSQWLWFHSTADEPVDRADIAREANLAAARRDMSDPGRARDFHRYAFTRSHLVGGTLTPQDRPKTGWTRHSPTFLSA